MKKCKTIFALASIVATLLCFAPAAPAYTLIGLDWNWLGGSPVTVGMYVNPNCADPNAPNELASLQAALNTWGAAGANFAFNYAGATSNIGHNLNGQNEINWSNEPGGGALAATSIWGSNGNMTENDIVFYEQWDWSTSNPSNSEFDVESVGLHELGHVLGLDHSQYQSAVMYYAIAPGEVQRILDPDDIAGIQAIYDSTGPATPVVLTSFSAQLSGSDVQLNWNTACEINCYGWMVQRGQEGEFASISALIPGYGTTEEPHSYSFTDGNARAGQTYSYRLQQMDIGGASTFSDPITITISDVPAEYKLAQNVPNPFNPATAISYSLPQTSHVKLSVFNSQGKNVATLVNGIREAGVHSITWNAAQAASGIYFCRLEAGAYSAVQKMVLMK